MASKKKVGTVAGAVGLAAIVAATQAGAGGFVYTSVAEHTPLVQDGLVEVNVSLADANGALATRATAKGIEKMNAGSQTAEVSGTLPTIKPQFQIDDSIPIPEITGRGRVGSSTYPFEQLQVGQSFFVPKEAKSLASTVSSANKRFSENVEGETRTDRKGNVVPKTKLTRHFIVRTVEGGSRIWRKA